MQKKMLRRLWHVLGGLFFPTLAFFVPQTPLVIALGALTAIAVSIEIARFSFPQINPWLAKRIPVALKEKEAFRPTGATYLLIGSLISLWVFQKEIAITALYFSALGDPAAAFVGESMGRLRFRKKSLEGFAACFVVCIVVGFLLTLYTHLSLPAVALAALAASAIEFLSLPTDDNLTMPLAAGLMMTLVRF
ncbi:MAG: hypothetical protein Q7T04_02455 [Dehalococcoidia bacterium]|nr:hypothetical protein [Dehalococcoidia bacterium]